MWARGACVGEAIVLLVMIVIVPSSHALRLTVTGASGYLGAEIVAQAAAQGHHVRAVLRDGSNTALLPPCVEVVEVDDLTNLAAAREVAADADAVIHTASVFRPCDDMEEELVRPNILLAEAMVCACAAAGARLVLTSSMAAVRGSGQPPACGAHYTTADWNTVSRRDGPGFEPYQWSKVASERRAWALAREVGLEMVALCPSMIFGPPRDPRSTAFSVQVASGAVERSSS
jgi:dihydroflavonol-4-reductase